MTGRSIPAASSAWTPAGAPSASAVARLAPALLLLALWMLAHPYLGVVHDAVYYTVQALREIHPETFAQDLFFAYGSQARYTAFPHLHAAAVRLAGLESGAMALVILGHALWIAGAVALLRRIARGPVLWLMLALVFAMPAGYGGLSVFAYGEGFATPRPYAEAATLLGLAVLLNGRAAAAFGLMPGAAVLHPIAALPGLAAAVVYLTLADRRWLLAPLAAAVAALALAWAGIAPFSGLLQTMDGAWLEVVAARNRYVFPSEWGAQGWNALTFDAAIMAAATALAAGRRRRLFATALIVGLGGVVASLIGGDLLRNVLVVQVQPWRGTWLLHVLAYPALAVVLLRLRRARTANGAPILAALAAAWLLPPSVGTIALAPAIAGLAVADARGRLRPLSRSGRRTVYALAALAALAWAGLYLWPSYLIWREGAAAGLSTVDGAATSIMWDFGVQAAVLALLAVRTLRRFPRLRAGTRIAVAMAAILAATLAWDRRTDWQALVDSPPRELTRFAALIPLDGQVYWAGDVTVPWFVLRRTSYVSAAQGAGVLFSRETALAYRERLREISPLDTRDRFSAFGSAAPAGSGTGPDDAAALAAVCRGARDLDFVALATLLDGHFRAAWHAPVPKAVYEVLGQDIRVTAERDYYLYACTDFRGRPPGPDR